MIHPNYETVNFEEMADASKPQTDRELMIQIGAEVKRLSESIDRFADKLENFEEKKLFGIDERVKKLEAKWSELNGAWKFWIILGGALALAISIAALINTMK